MKSNTFGRGGEGLLADALLINDTTTRTFITAAEDLNSLSYVVAVDNEVQSVSHTVGDAVVASTHTWTFAGFTFTGMTGAKITVTGAAQANNNGTFTIASVTSAHVIVTGGTQTNETFGAGVVVTIERADVPLQATMSFLVSNDRNIDGEYNCIPRAGRFVDITSEITSFPATVTVPLTDDVQLDPFSYRYGQWKIAPASGMGRFSLYVYGKGNR